MEGSGRGAGEEGGEVGEEFGFNEAEGAVFVARVGRKGSGAILVGAVEFRSLVRFGGADICFEIMIILSF